MFPGFPSEHVRRVCTTRALLVCVAVTIGLSFPRLAPAQTLANGWQTSAVGSPALPGSATDAECVQPAVSACAALTVTAGGVDIWGSSDQFRFVYQRLTGDAVVIARIESIEWAHAWSKAGVMMRESLDPGAPHGFALVSAGKGVAFQRRRISDGLSEHTSGGDAAAPVWLKLERRAAVVSAYRSDDGVYWTLMGSDTIALSETVYVGVAVTSHDEDTLTSASIASLLVAPLLPGGWESSDIGSPGLPGFARYSAGTFAVEAAGADIWNASDQFRFTYQPVSGDVDLVARVASLASGDNWTKAGVMVRESLAPDAAHASVFMTGAKGVAFQRRLSTGLPSVHTSGGAYDVPGWIKLERRGDVVTALFSADGLLWTVIGAELLPLPYTIYAGLAVTSHDAYAYTQAQFDGVTVARSHGSDSGSTPPDVVTSAAALAKFTPSPDNDTAVSYYVLDIFDAAADVSTAAPVISADVGKPAVVDGECTVDISSVVRSISSGSYVAVISAVGPGGRSSGAPSAVFTF